MYRLQVSVLADGCEVIVQIDRDSALLTICCPETERIAEVRLTALQAETLANALERVPVDE